MPAQASTAALSLPSYRIPLSVKTRLSPLPERIDPVVNVNTYTPLNEKCDQ